MNLLFLVVLLFALQYSFADNQLEMENENILDLVILFATNYTTLKHMTLLHCSNSTIFNYNFNTDFLKRLMTNDVYSNVNSIETDNDLEIMEKTLSAVDFNFHHKIIVLDVSCGKSNAVLHTVSIKCKMIVLNFWLNIVFCLCPVGIQVKFVS